METNESKLAARVAELETKLLHWVNMAKSTQWTSACYLIRDSEALLATAPVDPETAGTRAFAAAVGMVTK